MFPQSELDNYKLQVELLQQKLQRSEISRQQLEHKLDKILQKRDEHDKMVRTKARQKYQQFLEEQQRRNERNKQLVQMLERIEQQTEALNAKSERLKMMKLQYEMYFAKLVHSQTRRCIQNSIIPMTHMMATPATQHIQTATVQQPTLQGHNYDVSYETSTPRMTYPYHTHIPNSNYFENEPTSQSENIPTKTAEMPTLANLVTTSRNDCDNFRNLSVDPSTQLQQTQQYQPKYELTDNNSTAVPTNITFHKQEIPHNIFDSINNANILFNSVSNLLTNDKQISEFNENSNLPSTTSSTFEEVPNLAMMPQNGHNLKNVYQKTTMNTMNTYNDAANNKANLNITANVQQLRNSQDINKVPLKYTNETTDINATNSPQNIDNAKSATRNLRNEIKSPIDNTGYERKTNDTTTTPKLNKKPMTSFELENSATKEIETSSTNSAKNIKYINRQTELVTEQLEIESTAKHNESNSYATPTVSIENIENKIYGELLSPLEIEEVQKPEGTKNAPKLLENLVTQQQQENVIIENNTTEESLPENDGASNTSSVKDAAVIDNKNEQNYEQAYNDYNNTQQQPDDLSNNFADYTNYENVDSSAINNESQQQSQQQQLQQYDYSNYDPTQYSYPGYIYDEATGEYKPDPNAPAEQYATDQQYATEAYDQQYQQQNYDYNQSYMEDPTQRTACNNYDTQQQQDISPNLKQSDTNAEEQQAITNPEPITATTIQPDLKTEELPITSTKVVKPTSILATADNKNDSHKKKKRVNFIDSSETDNSASAEKVAPSTAKPTAGSLTGSSESDFDFPSSREAGSKVT